MHCNNWTEVRRRRRTGDTNASHRRILVATTFYAFGIPNNKGKRRFGNFFEGFEVGGGCLFGQKERLWKSVKENLSRCSVFLEGDDQVRKGTTEKDQSSCVQQQRHTPSLRRFFLEGDE